MKKRRRWDHRSAFLMSPNAFIAVHAIVIAWCVVVAPSNTLVTAQNETTTSTPTSTTLAPPASTAPPTTAVPTVMPNFQPDVTADLIAVTVTCSVVTVVLLGCTYYVYRKITTPIEELEGGGAAPGAEGEELAEVPSTALVAVDGDADLTASLLDSADVAVTITDRPEEEAEEPSNTGGKKRGRRKK